MEHKWCTTGNEGSCKNIFFWWNYNNRKKEGFPPYTKMFNNDQTLLLSISTDRRTSLNVPIGTYHLVSHPSSALQTETVFTKWILVHFVNFYTN